MAAPNYEPSKTFMACQTSRLALIRITASKNVALAPLVRREPSPRLPSEMRYAV